MKKSWSNNLFRFYTFLLIFGFSQTIRADEGHEFASDFPKYCKEVSIAQAEADGTYICFYPNLTLPETYERIKYSLDKGKFFKEEAFQKEKSRYKKKVHWVNKVGTSMEDSADVTYEWTKKSKLKIVVDQNSEIFNLIFEETEGGTKLTLIVETAY